MCCQGQINADRYQPETWGLADSDCLVLSFILSKKERQRLFRIVMGLGGNPSRVSNLVNNPHRNFHLNPYKLEIC